MPKNIFAFVIPNNGIITTVTKVTISPATKTIIPRFTVFLDKREQIPEMIMNMLQKIG
jgi:hypothetical protein